MALQWEGVTTELPWRAFFRSEKPLPALAVFPVTLTQIINRPNLRGGLRRETCLHWAPRHERALDCGRNAASAPVPSIWARGRTQVRRSGVPGIFGW